MFFLCPEQSQLWYLHRKCAALLAFYVRCRFTCTTPCDRTPAVNEPVKVPRSLWFTMSRTVAVDVALALAPGSIFTGVCM